MSTVDGLFKCRAISAELIHLLHHLRYERVRETLRLSRPSERTRTLPCNRSGVFCKIIDLRSSRGHLESYFEARRMRSHPRNGAAAVACAATILTFGLRIVGIEDSIFQSSAKNSKNRSRSQPFEDLAQEFRSVFCSRLRSWTSVHLKTPKIKRYD